MSSITPKLSSARFARVLAAATVALALVPAGASAATTWFGSSLNHEPANAGQSCTDFGLTGPTCTHVGSDYPGTSGHAQSTVNGTITSVRVRAEGPMSLRIKVVRVRGLSPDFTTGQAKALVASRLLSAQGPSQDQLDNGVYPIETFRVHLHVSKGNEIAVETNSNTAEYCSDGTPGQLLFDPSLSIGQPFQNSAAVDNCLMLVQAVVSH